MSRKVFYSFHYQPDNWRVSKIRQIGALEGNQYLSPNGWEEVTNGGEAAIEKWIDNQLSGRSCAIVLIGSQTSQRKWVKREIQKAWVAKKGLVGVHIHRITDANQQQASKGINPFAQFTVDNGKKQLTAYAETYDPPYSQSPNVYSYIADNIDDWVEHAIEQRNRYAGA